MGITAEGLMLELARVLEPLDDRLATGELELLFAELGLPASNVVLTTPQVLTKVGDARVELAKLPDIIDDLVESIQDEDAVAILADVVEAGLVIESVVSAVDAIADAIEDASAAAQAFAQELPDRLVGYLVSTYLDRHHPIVGGVAELLGIIENAPQPATATAPAHVKRILHLERLGPLLDDPATELTNLYGWGTSSFEWETLLRRLAQFANRISSFAFVQPGAAGQPSVLRIAFVDIGPTDDQIPGLQAILRAAVDDPLDIGVALSDTVTLEVGLETGVAASTAIELLPSGELRIDPVTTTAGVSGAARIGLAVTGPASAPLLLLGTAAGARIEAGTLRAAAGADVAWDTSKGWAEGEFVIEGAIEDGHVILSLDGADGFLKAILPEDGLSLDFDVLVGWSKARGVYIEGGAALAIDIPVDLDLGPVKIQMLHFILGLGSEGLSLEASGAISAKLGPFAIAVDRMGAILELQSPDGGGPAELAVKFKPPSGIGLSIDAGVVKGGGYIYLDPDAGEYAGLLELAVGPVSIKAIGILTTKLPGGADGWALLLLVFGEFSPIQLGYGFTLTGVGGIIGLQHGVDTAALQSGLRTGVLDSVLFPTDPVANAPTLIGQLRAVFPIVPRTLTIGPALKIGWSTPPLITLSMGLVLQFDDVLGAGPGQPALSRVVLLGRLKVRIPPVDSSPALIHLQIDIVGAYEVEEKALSIDAVLRDSNIAGLPVVGSMVVRARFGANPTFVMAVGGFHPRFTDLPPGLPPQSRLGIELRYGAVVVQILGYFAITSNSVQTGAEAHLVAEAASFRVEAFLGFDALFVFEPSFRFEIDFRLGASIKYKKISLSAISVSGRLTGPGRWEISGHATITVLFVDIGIDFSEAWGQAPASELPSIAVGLKLKDALSTQANWTAQLPAGGAALVSIRRVTAGTDVLAHPLGELVGMQKVVPLGITIDRVGRSRPSDGNKFDITGVQIGGAAVPLVFRDEHFARGEFLDLSEAAKLSQPSFERFRAGVAVSSAAYQVPNSQIAFEPEWETAYLTESKQPVRGFLAGKDMVAHAKLGGVAQSEIRATNRLLPDDMAPVMVAKVGYKAGTAADLAAASATSSPSTFTESAETAKANKGALVAELAELGGSQ